MDRHRKQLEVVLKPEAKPRGEVLPSDVRKVIVGEEEQQEWSSSVDQEDPEPPHIKEEELWSSQEREQLQGLEEADITKFTFTPVPVKSEDDEEKPQSEGHHCGGPGPGPDRNSDPNRYLGPVSEDRSLDSCETEVSDGNWEENREPQSGFTTLTTDDVNVGDNNCDYMERSFSCSECGKRFGRKLQLNTHMRIHTGEKPFSCSFCGKRFSKKSNSISHMRLHTGEKPFSCSVCKKTFRFSGDVSRHMRIHTGKKTSNTSDIISRRGGDVRPKKSRSVARSARERSAAGTI